jgi:peptide methionine sulfoxide reductase MsrA
MTEEQFKALMLQTEVFQQYENFKKNITLKRTNVQRLKSLYMQAEKYGIEYLKQNPNLMQSDVKLIENILLL